MASGKGISPLVATVLLIAATMSIAMILAFWASSFVKTTLPSVNETQQLCQFSDFEIFQCSYSTNSSSLLVVLHNLRQNPLGNMFLQLYFSNNTVSQVYNLTSSLPGSVYQSYSLANIPSSFSKIIVGSLTCTGIVPDKQQTCTVTS